MSAKKHLLLALTNPLPGRDEAFNEWYENVAYPTYKSLPGLVPLGRFKATNVPPMFPFEMTNQFEYLSLYFFEAEDPEAFMATIKEAFAKRPQYQFSPDIDQARFCEPIYAAIGDINFAPIDFYDQEKTAYL